ncbi:hypothetical protein ACGF3J_17955 [Streptomyces sp. NPDC048171]|uniref:hypothetical protein n=1 Tax=unclassified Streptomyces TaxID=2593676 RepID=UPI00136CE4ED|nr:hypothetical protein [Streptomyces sp. SID5789]MZE68499.1 hypothetical protein [Streptomyces sp. SID5789]
MTAPRRALHWSSAALTIALVGGVAPAAHANGTPGNTTSPPAEESPGGDRQGSTLLASVSQSRIQVTYPDGRTGSGSMEDLTSVDPNWEPPVCWYEPVFSPEQLKSAVTNLKKNGGLGAVNAHEFWTSGIFVDHYEEGEEQDNFDVNSSKNTMAKGYKDYNTGKDGMFWRSVVRKGHEQDTKAWDCGRVMFWQDAGTIPDDEHAPDPETLAAYAYDQIDVPKTEVELKPQTKSTVNLPTWVWLDKGTFKDVKVRAELPNTGLWAETTAKPVALHLEPGTADAETFPASGDCEINADGSIGMPYAKGKADETPPCGIRYLRASNGEPYQLKASITWEISWEGTGGATGDLPDGTFETTQDMNVQEIQSINR